MQGNTKLYKIDYTPQFQLQFVADYTNPTSQVKKKPEKVLFKNNNILSLFWCLDNHSCSFLCYKLSCKVSRIRTQLFFRSYAPFFNYHQEPNLTLEPATSSCPRSSNPGKYIRTHMHTHFLLLKKK